MSRKNTTTKRADPAIVAVANFMAAEKAAARAYIALSDFESKVQRRFGHRPFALIAWRSYSHIGGSEIDRARDEFLAAPGAVKAAVLAEYRDAKRRYRETLNSERDWDLRSGAAPVRAKAEQAKEARRVALRAMLATRPTTIKGAAAMLDAINRDLQMNDADWHTTLLERVTVALAKMAEA